MKRSILLTNFYHNFAQYQSMSNTGGYVIKVSFIYDVTHMITDDTLHEFKKDHPFNVSIR